MCFFFNRAPAHGTWGQAMTSMAKSAARFEQYLDTYSTGEVGVLIRPTEDQTHAQTKAEIERALTGMDRTHYRTEVVIDDQGHGWAVLKTTGLQDLAAGAAQMGDVFVAAGLSGRVVAGVFPFNWRPQLDTSNPTEIGSVPAPRTIYWIYQPRIRSFTPFAPEGNPANQERNHDLEVRMENAVRRSIPTARQTAEWYPIWGMPF